MKNFRRSLKYLWPYRGRLALSAVLVFLIAVLWGGGLGALLPGLKILIAPEGLHGWAWNSMLQDRLQARLVRQEVQADTRIDGLEVGLVLGVAGVEKDGPSEQAGIRPGDWIVGTEDGDPTHRVMPWRTLARMLALSPTGQELVLRLYNPRDGQAPRPVRPSAKPTSAASWPMRFSCHLSSPAGGPAAAGRRGPCTAGCRRRRSTR